MINRMHIRKYPFLASLILLAGQFLIPLSVTANTESNYQTLVWEDLVPEFPELDQLRNGADFSPAEISQVYQKIWDPENVVEELDGTAVRIPGFIVPLEFDEEQNVTQFFLVPYHGACIHSPAPPPNQLIMADYPGGFQLESLDTAYWVSGEMSLKIDGNELGTSGYAMQMHDFELYSP